MATHAIGKLKFNLSGQGLAYRWGDGTVHRLFQGKKRQGEDDDYLSESESGAEMADRDDYGAGEAYSDDRYADDGYDDDGYDDDSYADDDGYDDDGYADDDGYDDDGYDDDGYGDDDGYDDRGD